MPLAQLQVGLQGPLVIAANPVQAAGFEAETIVTELHGKYYAAAKAGRVFQQSVVVGGVAIPISSTVAPIIALWNPTGSGKNAVLIRYLANFVATPAIPGTIGLMALLQAGSNIGTGAPVVAFNTVAPVNGIIGGGLASAMRSSNAATNTLIAAGTWHTTLFANFTGTAAAVVPPSGPLIYDFDGTVIVPPGVLVYPAASAASALMQQTLIWEEVPV